VGESQGKGICKIELEIFGWIGPSGKLVRWWLKKSCKGMWSMLQQLHSFFLELCKVAGVRVLIQSVPWGPSFVESPWEGHDNTFRHGSVQSWLCFTGFGTARGYCRDSCVRIFPRSAVQCYNYHIYYYYLVLIVISIIINCYYYQCYNASSFQ
jgi:hypothetical protein